MGNMAGLFTKLESYPELEVSIIRVTRINKVLKMIVKLPFIPRDEEFHFRRRALNILSKWKNILDAEPESASTSERQRQPKANGVHKEDEQTPESPNKTEAEDGKKETDTKPSKEDESPEGLDTPMPDADAETEDKTAAPEPAAEPAAEKKVEGPAKEASDVTEAPKEDKVEEKTAEAAA